MGGRPARAATSWTPGPSMRWRRSEPRHAEGEICRADPRSWPASAGPDVASPYAARRHDDPHRRGHGPRARCARLLRAGRSRIQAIEVPNPLILVQVLSPSTPHIDASAKLAGYFSLPSVAHYLIVDPDKPLVIHHARREGDDDHDPHPDQRPDPRSTRQASKCRWRSSTAHRSPDGGRSERLRQPGVL